MRRGEEVVVVWEKEVEDILVKALAWEHQVGLMSLLEQLELKIRDHTTLVDVVKRSFACSCRLCSVCHDVFNEFLGSWKTWLRDLSVESENSPLSVIVVNVDISHMIEIVADDKS